ncbi:MAG TPA: Hsp20/alpha crystallin family protein [Polyangia bacterium]
MLGYWTNFERTFSPVDELRRRMESALGQFDTAAAAATDTNWPRTSVYEAGTNLVLVADLPGVKAEDVEVTLEKDVLTLAGQRKLEVPEGHAVHRQERRAARFSRSFSLPCKVDGEALNAELADGVLTITLPKAPEAQPRRIPVKAG